MPAKMTTAYRQHDRGARIIGESYRKGVRETAKTKKRNAAIDKELRSWRDVFGADNPALLIRQGENVIDAPRQFALSLIMHGVVRPVGDFNAVPNLVIGEDELLGAGHESTQEPSMLTVRLIEAVNEQLSAGAVLRVPTATGMELLRYSIAEPYGGNSDSAITITEAELL